MTTPVTVKLAELTRVQNFIGGAFADAASGQWLEDLAPATGQVIGRIARSNGDDVDEAVLAAEAALDSGWGGTSAAERAGWLDRIADGIEARFDEFADIESLDTGKPVSLARAVDIRRAVDNFRFFAGAVRHQETGSHASATALNYTLRQRLGVVGLITPWNLPLYLLSWKVAPALGMGNAVIAKPSELTPMSAHALCKVVSDVGLPAGAFNVVHGLGGEVGQPLVEHKDVAAISFTGGTATGSIVGAAAARTFKKTSLELGGKNPTLVFADCDFDATVKGVARAGFANQGQVCLCGSRILVERSIHDRFVAALAAQVASRRIGDPADPSTQHGSLISTAHRAKVEGYVAMARDLGGTVVTGGKRPLLASPFDQGAFYEPTVITGLPTSCRPATEEIFGPVVTVHPFDDELEAIAIANGVEYGLAASVWTRDLQRAHRVSAELHTGMVWINTWLLRDLRVPFGGVKHSGVGREGGRFSLEFYSSSKNVCVKL